MRTIGGKKAKKDVQTIDVKALEKKINALEKENEELKEKVGQLTKENEALEVEVEVKCSELKEIETELEALKTTPSDKEKNKK